MQDTLKHCCHYNQAVTWRVKTAGMIQRMQENHK
jgi:hypothetical protein